MRHVVSTTVAVALSIAITAVSAGVLVARPLGSSSPGEAARGAHDGVSRVLIQRSWGDGRLIVTGESPKDGVRTVALAFAVDFGRGWHVYDRAQRVAGLADVTVGSLLLATSPGGAGQPSWSAAFGELGDDRIRRIEIIWADGQKTTADREGSAYMIVRRGERKATLARYISADGMEVAQVPIE